MLNLRPFDVKDTEALLQLAHETIRFVNSADYSPPQVEAWIAGMSDISAWQERFSSSYTRIAEIDHAPVGFANLETDGHLDNLYCHAGRQRDGIATFLLDDMILKARELGFQRIYAEVSVTALGFFERKKFRVIREDMSPYRGQVFRRFEMELDLMPGKE